MSEFDTELNCEGLNCPLPILKTKKTIENIKSTEAELLKFGMEWLQYALFGEGNIRPRQK